MIHHVEPKQIPDGLYEGILLDRIEDAEKAANGKEAWIFISQHPKMIVLLIKTTEKKLFGYN